jgi:uncharacterized membrane protein YfcA
VTGLNYTDLGLLTSSLYLLTGALAGFASGLLGIGGGLLIVPVLFFIFSAQGYEQQYLMHMALTTSLATIFITSISSTLAHHKKHAVLWSFVFLLSPGIIIGSWLGGRFASDMDSEILGSGFAVFELLVAIYLLFKKQTSRHQTKINKAMATAGGIVIGFISTIVGIGGGTMTTPFLHWFNVSMRNAVATSAACGIPIALFGTLSFIYASWGLHISSAPSIGYLQLYALMIIASSSVVFAPLGAKLAHSISEKTLRLLFACILLVLSITMFSI